MTVREIVLAFVDAVMVRTVAAHEKLCDEGKCSLESPCAYCRVGEILMEEMEKLK